MHLLRFGKKTMTVLSNHGECPLGEITKVIGQIFIEPCDDSVMAIGAIFPKGDITQKKIAEGIAAVLSEQDVWVYGIAQRFRHLFSTIEDESMGSNMLGERESCSHKKGYPIHAMEACDVFANHMDVGWPETPCF